MTIPETLQFVSQLYENLNQVYNFNTDNSKTINLTGPAVKILTSNKSHKDLHYFQQTLKRVCIDNLQTAINHINKY